VNSNSRYKWEQNQMKMVPNTFNNNPR